MKIRRIQSGSEEFGVGFLAFRVVRERERSSVISEVIKAVFVFVLLLIIAAEIW